MSRVSVTAEKAGDNALGILARYKAALGLADAKLDSARTCTAKVRARFAAEGK